MVRVLSSVSLLSLFLFFSSLVSAIPFAVQKRDGAGSVVTNKAALTWYNASPTAGTAGRNPPNSYICYKGRANTFPAITTWVNYNKMWANAVQYAFTPVNDTALQQKQIKGGIETVSKESKVDQRVILAMILLESTGNLSNLATCTTSFGGIPNCGLMQSYNGTTYKPKQSSASIHQMIVDGTQGTQYGPGMVQLLNDAANTPKSSLGNIYRALREYNSGSINPVDLDDGRGATDGYVSNMANYLQGWNGYGDGYAQCTQYSTAAKAAVSPTATVTKVVTSTLAASTASATKA